MMDCGEGQTFEVDAGKKGCARSFCIQVCAVCRRGVHTGKDAVRFVNCCKFGDIAVESDRNPKGASIRWKMKRLSVPVQR